MAKLNVEQLINHLDLEVRKALEATLREYFPYEEYNSRAISKTFQKELGKRCKVWENIPNKFIRST